MLDLWFGLDASGFDRACECATVLGSFRLNVLIVEFDVTFGPVLMITYACLSNTLLLTGTLSSHSKSLAVYRK